MDIYQEIIWVTGASSGIGRELAIQLARAGNTVIVSGRNAPVLQDLAKVWPTMGVIPFDLSIEADVATASTTLNAAVPHLDRIILNAGVCEYLDADNPDWSQFNRAMDVNVLGPVRCIAMALPLLKRAKRPHIIGITSLSTVVPFPKAASYGSSKAAFQYVLNSLRIDFHPFGIDVSDIQPGFVDTPLTQKNDFSMPFALPVNLAAARIILAMAARKRHFAFPKRLDWPLRAFRHFPQLWQWFFTRKNASLAKKETTK